MSTQYFRINPRLGGAQRRCGPLEHLLARADSFSAVEDWRTEAFGVLAPAPASVPGIAACALWAQGSSDPGDAEWGDASVFLATPVRYVAEMSNVRLPADGLSRMQPGEAGALAADFNRIWNGAGCRLLAGRSGGLFCLFDRAIDARTTDPTEVLGRHLEPHLPVGADAARLRRLMSEIEMWLHEHEMNRQRASAAMPQVTGLWLWGGGPLLGSLPPVAGWTWGTDPLFGAFASESPHPAGVAISGAEPGAEEWMLGAAARLEASVADLRSGRISRLCVSGAKRRFDISAGWRRRFWRRSRPWWEYFA